MISIFNFNDYRSFVLASFASMPKRGYGQSARLADFIGVHTTLVSQVVKKQKSFSLEQASLAAEFFGLNDAETECFLLLVQLDRAGNASLKKNIERQLKSLREVHKRLSTRLQSETNLTEEKRAQFYSNWIYSAVRQLVAVKGYQSVDSIAQYFDLPQKQIREVIDFLLTTGLCIEEGNRLKIGVKATHLESTSPWLRTHHLNWRQKSMESLDSEDSETLHYTCPMTISRTDAEKNREMIVKFLEALDPVILPSPSEELRCLNIDWFKV